MHLKHDLCDIQTDCLSIHLGLPLSHEVIHEIATLAQHNPARDRESVPIGTFPQCLISKALLAGK
jgi:hypothetical protein